MVYKQKSKNLEKVQTNLGTDKIKEKQEPEQEMSQSVLMKKDPL